jgi:prepilin-type N-terminal cleavage/methylation domain-containing protein
MCPRPKHAARRTPALATWRSGRAARRGMTLTELVVAIGVMGMIAAALGTLALSIEIENQEIQGSADAVQHARVTLDRIQRTLRQATCAETYPGFLVVPEVIGTDSYPHTLVVWMPASGKPTNAAGPPLFSEIVVYSHDATSPEKLLELTDTTDTRTVPAWTNLASWRMEIAALKARATAKKTTLTNLVRTVAVTNNGTATKIPATRFEVENRPLAEVAQYRAGTKAWNEINWCLDLYSSTTGTCQAWCRIELQLLPGEKMQTKDTAGASAIPFFGSGAVLFQVTQ